MKTPHAATPLKSNCRLIFAHKNGRHEGKKDTAGFSLAWPQEAKNGSRRSQKRKARIDCLVIRHTLLLDFEIRMYICTVPCLV